MPKPAWCSADARERFESILHDIAPHLVDQALIMFGPVTRVYAELTRRHSDVVTFEITEAAFLSDQTGHVVSL